MDFDFTFVASKFEVNNTVIMVKRYQVNTPTFRYLDFIYS